MTKSSPIQPLSVRIPVENSAASNAIRRLVWLYFWLLIFEGALRKWVAPGLSGPLLVARDPVVILIFALALKENLIPQSRYLSFFLFVAIASLFLCLIQFLTLTVPVKVLAYGYRTDFLHLPLIFLLPRIFSLADVVKMGKAILFLSIPMALLMAQQFQSPADAFINRTAGVSESRQITSAMGRIRPAATFSFITGSVSFFTIVAAFVGYGISERKAYPRLLLLAAGLATALAVGVSGSRSAILGVALVAIFWAAGTMAAKRLVTTASRLAGFALIAGLLVTQLNFFQDRVTTFKEGTEVLTERWTMAADSERKAGGLIGRYLDSLLTPLRGIFTIPLFGHGLGVGTNAGAFLISGKAQFLLSEGEWGRVLMEMGPFVGILFIAFRVAFVVSLGRRCIYAAAARNLLPILLFSASALTLLNGQIAQPTTLGFCALFAGLCLTACEATDLEKAAASEPSTTPRAVNRLVQQHGPLTGVRGGLIQNRVRK